MIGIGEKATIPPILGQAARRKAIHRCPWWLLVGVATFTAAAPLLWSPYRFFDVLILTGPLGMAALATGLLSGYAGQISLGQGAILALGAYGSGISVVRFGLPPLLGMATGVVVALAVAMLTAPLLKLRGFTLALATLAVGLIITQAITNLGALTGGVNGLAVPTFAIAEFTVDTRAESFWVGWIPLTLTLAGITNLLRSRFGHAFTALQHDEDAARALGVPVFRYKATLWLIASGLTAAAGALYGHHLQFLSPDQFGIDTSVLIIAAVIVGGVGLRLGPVVGVALLQALPFITRDLGIAAPLATGLLLITVMVGYPGGLSELFLRLRRFAMERISQRA